MQFARAVAVLYLSGVWCAALLQFAHAQVQPSTLSVPLHAVDTRFTASSNTACGKSPGDSSTNFRPAITTASGVWFGTCGSLSNLPRLNSTAQYGSHFQFAVDSSNTNPTIVPIDGYVQGSDTYSAWDPVGKLQTNSLTWQSYGNSTGCKSTYSSEFLAYSATSDTFYSADCATYGIRMRHVSSPVDQLLDSTRQCIPSDTSYMCGSTPTVWNDGTTDHLFWIALAAGYSKPTKIVRQSVLRGGPVTNVTIVGTDPSSQTAPLCGNSVGNIFLRVHPNGKMLFGACPDGGLFYLDISDPSTPQTFHRVSTCTNAPFDLSHPLVITNNRAYVVCKQGQQYSFLIYPLSVSSSGIVSLSDNNYINLTPAACSSISSSAVAASSVAGRPDAIWVQCNSVTLSTNICGFGNALAVAAAGDTYACTPCPSGAYQNSYSFTADQSCTACSAGTYLASPTDRNCTFCPAGTYQSSASATLCTACATGTYQPATGSVACLACTTGVNPIYCPANPAALGSSSQLSPSFILITVLLVAIAKAFTLA